MQRSYVCTLIMSWTTASPISGLFWGNNNFYYVVLRKVLTCYPQINVSKNVNQLNWMATEMFKIYIFVSVMKLIFVYRQLKVHLTFLSAFLPIARHTVGIRKLNKGGSFCSIFLITYQLIQIFIWDFFTCLTLISNSKLVDGLLVSVEARIWKLLSENSDWIDFRIRGKDSNDSSVYQVLDLCESLKVFQVGEKVAVGAWYPKPI